MFSLFSKKLPDLSGVFVEAEAAGKKEISKWFAFAKKEVSSVSDLSGLEIAGENWFSRMKKAFLSVPVSTPVSAPLPVLRLEKTDSVVVTLSLPSFFSGILKAELIFVK